MTSNTHLLRKHWTSLIRRISSDVRVRFAPSPTGQLHLGGLRTALYNHLFARKHKGKFILRIEDTDQTRLVPNSVKNLIDILQWVGIDIDEGPTEGGSFGPYTQSERLSLYRKHADELLTTGKAYKCFCSEERLGLLRRSALSRREVPRYDNRCRHLKPADVLKYEEKRVGHVVRLKLEPSVATWKDLIYGDIKYDVASNEGDPVIIKSDDFPTYHFANVVDDHHMQISHVLRGLEWQVSTSKHIQLYEALGWQPPHFAHLPLLTNKDGKKLSKRQSDIDVKFYRDKGYFPESIISLLVQTGSGFDLKNHDHLTLDELANHFNISLLNTNSSRINFDNLPELNRMHLKRKVMEPAENVILTNHLRMKLEQKYGKHICEKENLSQKYLSSLLINVKDRLHFVEDLLLPEYEFIFVPPDLENTLQGNDIHISSDVLRRLCDDLKGAHFLPQTLSQILHSIPTYSDDSKHNYNSLEADKSRCGLEADKSRSRLVADKSRSGLEANKSRSGLEADKSRGRLEADKSGSGLEADKYSALMRTLRMALGGSKKGLSVVEMLILLSKEKALSRLEAASRYLSSTHPRS